MGTDSFSPGPDDKKKLRKYARIATNLYITYTIPGAKMTETGVFITKDVSGGGILFESFEEIPVGTVFDLLIHLPTTVSPIPAKGRVVRTEKTRHYGRYDVGMFLTEISYQDRRDLIKYLISTVITPQDYESLFWEEEHWKNFFSESDTLKRTEATP